MLQCICSCVTLPSQVHRRQTSSTSSSCSGRASLVICQDKTHLVEFPLRRRSHRSCSRLEKRTRPEVSPDRARRSSYQRQHRSMMNQSSHQSQKMSQSSAVSSWTKKNQHHRTFSHRHRWSSRQSSSEQRQCQSPNYQLLFWSTAACRCWSGASRSG